MQHKIRVSVEEKERLFHTELVRLGVPYHKAAKVAQILATEKPDELLTEEEIQLTTEVCREWLEQRDRWLALLAKIDTILFK